MATDTKHPTTAPATPATPATPESITLIAGKRHVTVRTEAAAAYLISYGWERV